MLAEGLPVLWSWAATLPLSWAVLVQPPSRQMPTALPPCSMGPDSWYSLLTAQLWTKHSTLFSPPSLHKPEGSHCDFYCADEETEALRGLEVACR